MMETVNRKINGMPITVPKNYTILQAAREAGFNIPTLCYLKEINEIGACRVCVVEVKGARSLVAACVYPVSEGLEVSTNSLKVQKSRRTTLELILSNHDRRCPVSYTHLLEGFAVDDLGEEVVLRKVEPGPAAALPGHAGAVELGEAVVVRRAQN